MGTGLRALGATLGARLARLGEPLGASVLLSHLHYDHVLGLPFFAPMRDPGAVLDVYGPSQEKSSLRGVLSRMVRPPFFPVTMSDFRGKLRFHDLDGPVEFQVGSTRISARTVPHIGHTLGFRIEAEGRTVVYIPDHQAPAGLDTIEEEVLALCDGADLVIHDSQFTHEEFGILSDWGHSTGHYAAHVVRESGARKLVLFHHDPSHTDEEIDKMLDDVRNGNAGAARSVTDVERAEGPGTGVPSGPGGNDADVTIDITAASEGATVDLEAR